MFEIIFQLFFLLLYIYTFRFAQRNLKQRIYENNVYLCKIDNRFCTFKY